MGQHSANVCFKALLLFGCVAFNGLALPLPNDKSPPSIFGGLSELPMVAADGVQKAISSAVESASGFAESAKAAFQGQSDKTADSVTEAVESGKQAITEAVDKAKEQSDALAKAVTDAADSAKSIADSVGKVQGQVSDQINSAKDAIGEALKKVPGVSNIQETFGKVNGILSDIQNQETERIQDDHLSGEVRNAIQEQLKSPISDAVGSVGFFSKIQECFKTLPEDVKKAVDAVKETYEGCRKENQSDLAGCLNPAVDTLKKELEPLQTNIKTCIDKNNTTEQ
ncbi:30 kDa salivary gland allergen Aed a 3-like isoform X2 [Uranotaenia lowii]|uniref:30 kDa salivary gland allergen Aed a 3-like isoform X2 n=1 Tax=Uranotaenia lowii TaxID=190385 RepID=UPI00247B0804|nr:30 kDa salivary gland allergen Aed a 3-like isoform X2 [Uranotaenia lowii]